jgi:hypothetical protein
MAISATTPVLASAVLVSNALMTDARCRAGRTTGTSSELETSSEMAHTKYPCIEISALAAEAFGRESNAKGIEYFWKLLQTESIDRATDRPAERRLSSSVAFAHLKPVGDAALLRQQNQHRRSGTASKFWKGFEIQRCPHSVVSYADRPPVDFRSAPISRYV